METIASIKVSLGTCASNAFANNQRFLHKSATSADYRIRVATFAPIRASRSGALAPTVISWDKTKGRARVCISFIGVV